MNPGRRARACLTGVLACGLVLGPAPRGLAQEAERNLPVRPFGLRDVEGWLEFEYEYENESVSTPRGADRETTRSEFAEGVEVRTHSYIYHPYVADLHFDAKLRAEQEQRDISSSDADLGDQENFLDQVRADLTLAKMKPLVTHLFYHRLTEEQSTGASTNPTLARGFELDTTSYGVNMAYGDQSWPAQLYVARTLSEGVGLVRTDEDDLEGLLTLDNDRDALDTHIALRYDDTADSFRDTDTEAITADVRQVFLFGDAQQHALNSNLRYFDEAGTTVREQIDVNEALTYTIDDRWRARTLGTYQDVTLPDEEITTWTALGEISHQLHGSLNTRANVRTRQSESMFTKSDDLEGLIEFRYRKRVPGGLLSASLTLRQLYEEDSSSTGRERVLDELHTFGTGVPVLLDHPNVILTSVVVTDVSGVPTFVEGIDYLLIAQGVQTEIVRLASGNILPDADVLVDYQFQVPEFLETESFIVNTSARLSLWQWLSIYGNVQNTDKTVTKGVDTTGVATDSHGWLAGIETQYRSLTLIGELEHFDDGLNAYDRRFAQANYTESVFGSWYGFGTASWTLTSVDDPPQDITTVDFRLGVQGDVGRWGHAELDAWLRTESGRAEAEDTLSTGIRAILDWRVRRVHGRLQLVHVIEEDAGGQELTRDEVTVSVRRRF